MAGNKTFQMIAFDGLKGGFGGPGSSKFDAYSLAGAQYPYGPPRNHPVLSGNSIVLGLLPEEKSASKGSNLTMGLILTSLTVLMALGIFGGTLLLGKDKRD